MHLRIGCACANCACSTALALNCADPRTPAPALARLRQLDSACACACGGSTAPASPLARQILRLRLRRLDSHRIAYHIRSRIRIHNRNHFRCTSRCVTKSLLVPPAGWGCAWASLALRGAIVAAGARSLVRPRTRSPGIPTCPARSPQGANHGFPVVY